MKLATLVSSLLLVLACSREPTPASQAELPEHNAPTQVPALKAPQPKVPKLLSQPVSTPDSILSERLNWLRYDISAVIQLSINQQGEVVRSAIVSTVPVDDALAQDFAAHAARSFEHARFEVLPGVEFPYSFNINVQVAASRDASGRLK